MIIKRRVRVWLIAAGLASLCLLAIVAAYALDRRFNPVRRMAATGVFPPNDDARAWAAMPRLPGQVFVIAGREQDAGASRTHPYLTFADGRYLAMWSQNPDGEFDQGYQVMFASSQDGRTWTDPLPLTAPAPHGWRRFARGFWLRDGQVNALVSQDELGPYFGRSLGLYAIAVDHNLHLGPSRLVAKGVINNFAPEWLASRREWLFASRHPPLQVGFMHGGRRSVADWRPIAVPAAERRIGFAYWPVPRHGVRSSWPTIRYPVLADAMLDEPVWWQAADGRLVAMFRSNDRRQLFRAMSSDSGATWTTPRATNFPNAISKIAVLRLSSGLFVLASNPRWQQRGRLRSPLTLSISRDGLTFDASFILRDAATRPRRRTAGRKAGYQYPQLFEHGGQLLVTYTRNGENIEVVALPLSGVSAAYAAR